MTCNKNVTFYFFIKILWHSLKSAGPETRDPGPWDPKPSTQDLRSWDLGPWDLGLATLEHEIVTPGTLEMVPGTLRLATDLHHRLY